jgi:hypothetical protein
MLSFIKDPCEVKVLTLRDHLIKYGCPHRTNSFYS